VLAVVLGSGGGRWPVLLAIFKFEIWPDSVEAWELMGDGTAESVRWRSSSASHRCAHPVQALHLERRVSPRPAAVIADDSHREVRNLLEAWRSRPGSHRRVRRDRRPCPNSFGVGTQPKDAIVAVNASATSCHG
jgi:hypothetical protein